MDKDFWQELVKNEYATPNGYSLEELTTELFSYLGSTDPELRDDIGYMVYANWLKMGLYSQETIIGHITKLTENLKTGINEQDTDSVFLRTFSILFLAEIVHNDNKDPKLEKKVIDEILGKAIWYLEYEQDLRGYIQAKGWAHALAHTADLLLVLVKNQHTNAAQHLQILNEITEKLANTSDWVYAHGEDDRLSAAVLTVFQRGLLKPDDVRDLFSSFTGNWKGAWTDEKRTLAFFNLRNFLRSLHLQIVTEESLPDQGEMKKVVLNAVQELRPY